MGVNKIRAAGFTFEVADVADLATATWIPLKGLNTFTESSDDSNTDVSTFEDAGYKSNLTVTRGYGLSVEGFMLEDEVTGDRDPGQEFVESKAEEVGQAAFMMMRITSPGGTKKVYEGSPSLSDVGGGQEDAASWGFEMMVNGKPELDTTTAPVTP